MQLKQAWSSPLGLFLVGLACFGGGAVLHNYGGSWMSRPGHSPIIEHYESPLIAKPFIVVGVLLVGISLVWAAARLLKRFTS